MSWNHRVTRKMIRGAPLFEIREVYYLDEGKLGWTASAVYPSGDTLDELKADFETMALAFEKPVLDITDEKNPHDVEDP